MRRVEVLLGCALALTIWSGCTPPASGDFGTPASTTPGEVPFEMAPPNDAAIIVPVKINAGAIQVRARHGRDFYLHRSETSRSIEAAGVARTIRSRRAFGHHRR